MTVGGRTLFVQAYRISFDLIEQFNRCRRFIEPPRQQNSRFWTS